MRRILPIILTAAALAIGAYFGYHRGHEERQPVLAGPTLEVFFLDASLGNGILINTPEGKSLLIDPGPESTARSLVDFLRARAPKELSVLVTRPMVQRAGALGAVLDSMPVDKIYRGEMEGRSRTWTRTIEAAVERGTVHELLHAKDVIKLTRSTRITALSPPVGLLPEVASSSDNNCLIMRLDFRGKRFLLPSDARIAAESYLIRSGADVRSDVLMAPHHGRYGSMSLELLREVRPAVCIISAGTGADRPSAAVMNRLNPDNTGASLYRTDRHGIVQVVTDGKSIVVKPGGGRE